MICCCLMLSLLIPKSTLSTHPINSPSPLPSYLLSSSHYTFTPPPPLLSPLSSPLPASTGLNLLDGGNSGLLSVATNGVKIYSGGFSLPNSGLPVTGGVTIANSGLTVTGGMTIYDYIYTTVHHTPSLFLSYSHN